MLSLHGGWPTGPQSCPGFLTTVDRLHKHTNSIRKVEEAPGSVVLTRVRFITWPSSEMIDNEIILYSELKSNLKIGISFESNAVVAVIWYGLPCALEFRSWMGDPVFYLTLWILPSGAQFSTAWNMSRMMVRFIIPVRIFGIVPGVRSCHNGCFAIHLELKITMQL